MEIKAKIYKKGATGKWILNYIHPKTDKRVRKSFEQKRAAKVYLDELKSSLILKKRDRENGTTINQIIDEYVGKYPESSFSKVKIFVRLFREKFGNEKPKEVTPSILREWLIVLREKHGYSLKSLGNLKGQIQVIFTYMKREGHIAANPGKQIKFRNRVDFYSRDKLSQDDMKKIFENLYYYSPYFLYHFIYVMYYTGLTKQELVDLKWEHINFNENRINVVSPKAGFVRAIPVPDDVIKILKGKPRHIEYALTNRLGRKIDPNHVGRYLVRFRERFSDTPKFNMDDIRNAFAYHYLERGGSMNELTVMLGHSSRDSTVRLYGRPRRIFSQGEAATDEKIRAADWGIEVIN